MHLHTKNAVFELENGPVFEGTSFGAPVCVSGEAVFTTSLVGYPESMTDPSYTGQILVFTQPLIGNYGVPSMNEKDEFGLLEHFESSHIHVVGIVVADYAYEYSHWTAVESLASWCQREGVAAITGVDTREIVQYLRSQGSTLGRITVKSKPSVKYTDPMKTNLVSKVSNPTPRVIKPKQAVAHIALIDCGVKENIIRCLVQRGLAVTILPFDVKIQQSAHSFDGVFISNGPGDPTSCLDTTVSNLKELLQDPTLQELPIFGICLGHQLLALASNGKTIKLKYGNRAHNIPVMDLVTGKCHITSQNHGYAVDVGSLPDTEWQLFFVNLNDGSNEGMIHKTRPIFSTQFHPEACGGPHDTMFLFDKYLQNIHNYRSSSKSSSK